MQQMADEDAVETTAVLNSDCSRICRGCKVCGSKRRQQFRAMASQRMQELADALRSGLCVYVLLIAYVLMVFLNLSVCSYGILKLI